MARVAVSDIVSSPQNGLIASGNKDTKVTEGQELSFQNLLSNPKQTGEQTTWNNVASGKSGNDIDAGVRQTESTVKTEDKRAAVKIDDASKPKELTAEQKTKAENAVTEFEEKVTEALSEELDVTEDEIAAAMETLGLTFLDLMQPDNVVQLVAELTETAEPIDLLTNQNLNGIMDQVSELAQNLTEESGIPVEDLVSLGMTETDNEMTVGEAVPENFVETAVEVKAEAGKTEGPEPLKAQPREQEELPSAVETEKEPLESEILRTGGVTAETESTGDENAGMHSEEEEAPAGSRLGLEKENAPKTEFHEAQHQAANAQQTEGPISPEAPAAEEAPRPVVDVRELMEQFTEFARTNITANTSEIEMRLNPESLGRLLIHVTEQEGNVRASITTQNVEVKEALESQLAVLRTTLEGQGMKVTEVEVTVASHEFEENLEKDNTSATGGEQEGTRERDEEGTGGAPRRNLNMNDLDSLSGLMTEEEQLAASIMRDNGNSVDFSA